MNNERILILIFSGFGAGIAIRSFVNIGLPVVLFILVLAVFSFVFWFVRKNIIFISFFIFLSALSIGILRYQFKDMQNISSELKPYADSEVVVRGIVVDEPDERQNSTKLLLKAEEVFNWSEKKWISVPGDLILVNAPRYPEYKYGDKLKIEGRLKEPEAFPSTNPGQEGRVFDYPAYLAKDGIFLEIFYPDLEKEGEGGSSVKRSLFYLKNKYLESVSGVLPEPHASFLSGLTLGAKRSMPAELLDDFRKVGVIHIVVLSGYNVTIIAKAVASVFRSFLPWGASIFLGMSGIIAFAIIAGASATVVRASIMALLIYFAQATGQIYRVSIALFTAGFFMLLHNPKLLRFDASFQLSFVATLGLIYLAPKLEGLLNFIPVKFKNVREVLLATLSAQIAVTPIILHSMGTFSLSALPVNALILITVPFAMLFGFLSGVLGLVSQIMAFPFAWLAYVILSYDLKVVEVFSNLPFSELNISYFPFIAVVVVYAFLGWFVFFKQKNKWPGGN
ncbi:MAG: hypothetical protein COU46_01280 [Candidatus Niyogibacteria bacterium CG10_big_fil_rev_8_21_14_0_10_42_19]|uniref:ComEC/Rec2-related protein domain-containing protein n=1 Tax=Candidatus Niyogibacteria bacterium CG10_big_fil_rev_8_21_14_0_10_42_19 TaxID=1974725 RepID=A0A2H0TFZ9_9BACT|nr:MAG: hypothetical protein COU46_01280 [Candidatus Niyogibacteria bacterium CG10_big_fil_rev_8_21_14_0_10_42_19]